MPSQRLLKMMDPLGHLGPRRMLASPAAKAVVWAPLAARAEWIAGELRAAGIEPLLATAFRHVDSSMRIAARPPCALAVIDFTAVSETDLSTLIAARWAGYVGPIISVGEIHPRTSALVQIAAHAFQEDGEPLRDIAARLLGLKPR
jgi:hypothetical protein